MNICKVLIPASLAKLAQAFGSIAFLLSPCMANATTPEEDQLFHASMPHEYLSPAGAKVPVHRLRLDGYMESTPDNQVQLTQWKKAVQQCVARNAEHGIASNPPGDWPKYTSAMRTDTYVAANRVITYSATTAYGFNPDCSLQGHYGLTARLVSSKGSCSIDMLKKTARGMCDASGHASASVQSNRGVAGDAQSRARIDQMAADPRYAAMFAAVKREQTSQISTGQTKTIAGAQCEVFNQVPRSAGGLGGTQCLLLGGSLKPPVTGLTAAGRIGLEVDGEIGAKMKAVDVSLDTEVSEHVFTPYLEGGFSITGGGPSK